MQTWYRNPLQSRVGLRIRSCILQRKHTLCSVYMIFRFFAVRQERQRVRRQLRSHNLPMLVSCRWDTCDSWATWGAGCTDILHCAGCSGSPAWYLSKGTWFAASCASCPELAPRLCLEKSRSVLSMIPAGCTEQPRRLSTPELQSQTLWIG